MSISDRKAWLVYNYFGDHPVGSDRGRMVVEMTNNIMDGIIDTCSGTTIATPKHDKCMNLELAIFRSLAEANRIDIEAVYRML